MKQIKSGRMFIAASVLTLCLFGVQAKTMATDITGVSVGPDGHTYNIDPSGYNSGVGYRKYQNFNLSEGDIANLIFKYGKENVEKFVNLVDNTININGILNTMRDGNFYNGKAIFISPNGMVVGASGVLNVGSLSVITPTQDVFNKYKGEYYSNGQLSTLFQSQDPVTNEGSGTVTINGKIIARNAINIQAADVNVNPGAGVLAGVNDSTALTTETQAKNLFDAIVNTSNMNEANSFVSDKGSIAIKAYGTDGGIRIASDMTNYGNGNITLQNSGSKGIDITSNSTISN